MPVALLPCLPAKLLAQNAPGTTAVTQVAACDGVGLLVAAVIAFEGAAEGTGVVARNGVADGVLAITGLGVALGTFVGAGVGVAVLIGGTRLTRLIEPF